MSDLSVDVVHLTRRTKDLSWESLPRQLSLDLDMAQVTSSKILIGKFFGLKLPRKNVVMSLISSVWKFAEDLHIYALENSTYLFYFSRSQDKASVLQLAPWNFNGYHLLLQHWSPKLSIAEVNLSMATFWIQLHSLLMVGMNKTNICAIGASIGTLVDMDPLLDGIACKRFFRIKVSFNTSHPLKHGFCFPRPNYPDAFIKFCYKKLSDLCYQCGHLGHATLLPLRG